MSTVVVKLVRSDNNSVVASHVFGTGAIHQVVQIDSTDLVYETTFNRGDLPASPGWSATSSRSISWRLTGT